MIAYLSGRLLEKHPNQVIVDVHGVGYNVTIPVSAYSSLPETDAEVHLHIHTHVREDALALFDAIHSVDRPSLCAALAKEIAKGGRQPQLFVEVNTGSEHWPQARDYRPKRARSGGSGGCDPFGIGGAARAHSRRRKENG